MAWFFAKVLPALLVVRLKVDVLMALFKLHRLEDGASFLSVFLPFWELDAWFLTAGDDGVSTAFFSFPSSDEIFDIIFNSVGWGGEIVMVVTVEVTAKTGKLRLVVSGGLDVDGVAVPGEPVAVTGDG